jgi:hypothetical protein
MYTGTADHALTAELVSLVDVPVVASGDVTSAPAHRASSRRRERRRSWSAAGPGEPVGAARDRGRGDDEPTREEVAAELVLFVRETVRELGERRASGFLKKFYGWYLGRAASRRSSSRSSSSSTRPRGRAATAAAAPGAFEIVERLEAGIPSGAELTLELPVSIYGGG